MIAAAAPNRARAGQRLPAVRRKQVRLWLWLPVTPLFWFLSPLALLFAPIVWLAIPWRTGNPYAWALAVGRLLLSLSGLVVDLETPQARVFIRIF